MIFDDGMEWADKDIDIETLAKEQGAPVVLMDYRVSRRGKIHVTYDHTDRVPRAFVNAIDAIHYANTLADGVLIIAGMDNRGRLQAGRATIKPLAESSE